MIDRLFQSEAPSKEVVDIDELEDDSVTEVLCHPQYRLPDNTISMEGRLVDWKTPYEESVGVLKKHRNRFQLVTFEDLR